MYSRSFFGSEKISGGRRCAASASPQRPPLVVGGLVYEKTHEDWVQPPAVDEAVTCVEFAISLIDWTRVKRAGSEIASSLRSLMFSPETVGAERALELASNANMTSEPMTPGRFAKRKSGEIFGSPDGIFWGAILIYVGNLQRGWCNGCDALRRVLLEFRERIVLARTRANVHHKRHIRICARRLLFHQNTTSGERDTYIPTGREGTTPKRFGTRLNRGAERTPLLLLWFLSWLVTQP